MHRGILLQSIVHVVLLCSMYVLTALYSEHSDLKDRTCTYNSVYGNILLPGICVAQERSRFKDKINKSARFWSQNIVTGKVSAERTGLIWKVLPIVDSNRFIAFGVFASNSWILPSISAVLASN